MGTKFASGKFAHRFCDRCAFRYPYAELKELIEKNNRTGIFVCKVCWEPSHPQLRQGEKKVVDPEGLRDPRPDANLAVSRNVFVNDDQEALARELGIYDQLDLGE